MPRTNVNRVGNAVKDFNDHVLITLHHQHKTQKDLAEYLGISRGTLCQKVNGQVSWTLEQFFETKEFLGEEI